MKDRYVRWQLATSSAVSTMLAALLIVLAQAAFANDFESAADRREERRANRQAEDRQEEMAMSQAPRDAKDYVKLSQRLSSKEYKLAGLRLTDARYYADEEMRQRRREAQQGDEAQEDIGRRERDLAGEVQESEVQVELERERIYEGKDRNNFLRQLQE